MTEEERAQEYVRLRVQAQSDAIDAADEYLLACALELHNILWGYRLQLSDTQRLAQKSQRRLDEVLERYANRIELAYEDYCMASIRTNGWSDGQEVVTSYMNGKIEGKTFTERNNTYMERFGKDIMNLLGTAYFFGIAKVDLEGYVRQHYKAPYSAPYISKAQAEGYRLTLPKYGFGISKAAYSQITKNMGDSVSLVWGYADFERAYAAGATGFYVHRGSSYPCQTCGMHTGWLHTMKDEYPPFHSHCVCYPTFTY